MKKKYLVPELTVFVLSTAGLIASSKGVYGSLNPSAGGDSEDILGFGGIDEDGDFDPE